MNKADLKNISCANSYALVAAHEAFNDTNWSPKTIEEQVRCGVSIATGMCKYLFRLFEIF
jgi:3-oxoacyl-(acyl-carrier-protein) synthase